MAGEPSAAVLVARYLKANHYQQTLEVFLSETGLDENSATTKRGDWTIEKIVQEKIQFDATLAFERRQDSGPKGWTEPAPSQHIEPHPELQSNLLHVSCDNQHEGMVVTAADQSLRTIQSTEYSSYDESCRVSGDSPVLSISPVLDRFQLSTSMSGKLMLRETSNLRLVDECRNHTKYAVQVASHLDANLWIVATIAWDQKIIFYTPDLALLQSLDISAESTVESQCFAPGLLGKPIHTESMPSSPESIVFVQHPDTRQLYLVASRRDSTFIYYYKVATNEDDHTTVAIEPAGRQNLAPHSNAWVAFSPCSLAICPTDSNLLAVATSQIPHMKLIVVRLLFPDTLRQASEQAQTVAALAKADLALQDKEDAAISLHVTTMAPQTPYSTPQVVWRPDATGLWVNGDDGVIRGVETSTGKVIRLLKGHESGSKVRTLWAGMLNNGGTLQEVLLSGGFDKKMLLWSVAS